LEVLIVAMCRSDEQSTAASQNDNVVEGCAAQAFPAGSSAAFDTPQEPVDDMTPQGVIDVVPHLL
jgi:hypothetical protein